MSIVKVHGKDTTFGHVAHYVDRLGATYPALIVQLGSGVDTPVANLLVFKRNGDMKPELDVPYDVLGGPNTWNHLPTEGESQPTKKELKDAAQSSDNSGVVTNQVGEPLPVQPPASDSASQGASSDSKSK